MTASGFPGPPAVYTRLPSRTRMSMLPRPRSWCRWPLCGQLARRAGYRWWVSNTVMVRSPKSTIPSAIVVLLVKVPDPTRRRGPGDVSPACVDELPEGLGLARVVDDPGELGRLDLDGVTLPVQVDAPDLVDGDEQVPDP